MEEETEFAPLTRFEEPHALDRIPSDQQFELMLASADGAEGLRDLRKLMAAAEAVAKQCDLAFEEMLRLAVNRLRVERELGRQLAQATGRGGVGSKSHRVTSKRGGASNPLPAGVTKQEAQRYRLLASVPDIAFARYLEEAREKRTIPTAAGARRLVREPRERSPRKASPSAAEIVLSPEVLDWITRIMEVDVLVGAANIPAAKRVRWNPDPNQFSLAGNVFVSDCKQPDVWLPELVRLHKCAAIERVVVALRAEVWEPWFRLLTREWRCCFLSGHKSNVGGLLLAHHGVRGAAFSAVMGQHGWIGAAE